MRVECSAAVETLFARRMCPSTASGERRPDERPPKTRLYERLWRKEVLRRGNKSSANALNGADVARLPFRAGVDR